MPREQSHDTPSNIRDPAGLFGTVARGIMLRLTLMAMLMTMLMPMLMQESRCRLEMTDDYAALGEITSEAFTCVDNS